MAVSLQEQWDATYGPTQFADAWRNVDSTHFVQRVSMAATNAALAIAAEATSTADHANRAALAKAVLDNPAAWMMPFAQACASQGLDQTSTDAQISTMMGSIWNGLAGVV